MSGACLDGVYIACRVNSRRHSGAVAGLVGRLRPVSPTSGTLRGHRTNLRPVLHPVLALGTRRRAITRPRGGVDRLRNRWVDSLRDTIAAATVSVYWRNLRPFFSWWAKETDQPNPFRGADVPSAPLEPPDVVHLDDIRTLLDTCKGRDFTSLRDAAVIRVLFDTGCSGSNAATASLSPSTPTQPGQQRQHDGPPAPWAQGGRVDTERSPLRHDPALPAFTYGGKV
jgi:hypothetical protein